MIITLWFKTFNVSTASARLIFISWYLYLLVISLWIYQVWNKGVNYEISKYAHFYNIHVRPLHTFFTIDFRVRWQSLQKYPGTSTFLSKRNWDKIIMSLSLFVICFRTCGQVCWWHSLQSSLSLVLWPGDPEIYNK